jgi:hypothetical protein
MDTSDAVCQRQVQGWGWGCGPGQCVKSTPEMAAVVAEEAAKNLAALRGEYSQR